MAWVILLVAGLFEIVWAVGLKHTQGFTRLWPSVITIVALAISMGLLAVAVRSIPIGTAYAVWVGIGAAGVAIIGVVALHEPISIGRAIFLLLLIVSIVGLKLSAPAAGEPVVAPGSVPPTFPD